MTFAARHAHARAVRWGLGLGVGAAAWAISHGAAAQIGVTPSSPGEARWLLRIAGVLCFVPGAVGLYLTLRERARRRANDATQGAATATPESSTSMLAELRQTPAPPTADAGKRCPTCRNRYDGAPGFCPLDGNRLVADDGDDTRAGTGGICPTCLLGWDPGVEQCPDDDDELVPAPLALEAQERELRPDHRICPVCGLRQPGSANFCPNDRAALVDVN